MRWLINYIRSCFCKHDWECLENGISIWSDEKSKYPSAHQWTYRCKKCGWKNRIRT